MALHLTPHEDGELLLGFEARLNLERGRFSLKGRPTNARRVTQALGTPPDGAVRVSVAGFLIPPGGTGADLEEWSLSRDVPGLSIRNAWELGTLLHDLARAAVVANSRKGETPPAIYLNTVRIDVLPGRAARGRDGRFISAANLARLTQGLPMRDRRGRFVKRRGLRPAPTLRARDARGRFLPSKGR